MQELVISWMWVVREEYQAWLPDGWLYEWAAPRFNGTKDGMGKRQLNGILRTEFWEIRTRWKRPLAIRNQCLKLSRPQSRVESLDQQETASYRRHLNAAGSGGHEAGQTPQGKPELSVRSTERLRLAGSDPPLLCHFINRNTLVCASNLSTWSHQCYWLQKIYIKTFK